MNSTKKFDCNVIEHYATLSTSGNVTKEFNLVSYDGNRPKYDLRSWKREADGRKKPLRGLTLTDEEATILGAVFGSGILANETAQDTDEDEDEDELELSGEFIEDLI